MLRQAEKLRNEACDNGNINWDDNFSWFCVFLRDTLTGSGIFEMEKNDKLTQILEYLKENGEYARSCADERIEDCNLFYLVYTDSDLYDYLEDAIAEYYLKYKEPIPYDKKEFISR